MGDPFTSEERQGKLGFALDTARLMGDSFDLPFAEQQ